MDFLKIDGAFIRDLHTDRMEHAMVSAIQRIAAELGIRTIAEYVETEAVREEVRALSVNYVQAFHIDRSARRSPALITNSVPQRYAGAPRKAVPKQNRPGDTRILTLGHNTPGNQNASCVHGPDAGQRDRATRRDVP